MTHTQPAPTTTDPRISEVKAHSLNGTEGPPIVTITPDTATAADTAGELTDGYHLVVEALKLNDIRTIYGVVGIPVTDVARVAQASGIRYIGFRHESDAGHAAAAAGFLTKQPGVCLTVSAPGFLNGLVALANATTNCFPMVQISGSQRAAHRRPQTRTT
jgi:oxalyl-CoA decarboxylase